MSYQYGAEVLRSAVPLPELLAATSDVGLTPPWHLAPSSSAVPRSWRRLREWRDDAGVEWLRIDRAGSAFRLTFALGPTFVADDRSIVWMDGGAPADTVRHLLLDQVMPLVLSTRGVFGLHASAVTSGDGALVFLGPSGVGKSTLAARFARAASAVLADDYVVLNGRAQRWWARGAYPGLRLWRDAAAALGADASTPVAPYTSKQRTVAPAASGPDRLRRLYLVSSARADAPVTVMPALAADVAAIIRCAFRLDVTDRAGIASDFAGAADLIDQNLVRRLCIPHDFTRLDEVMTVIAEDVRASAS